MLGDYVVNYQTYSSQISTGGSLRPGATAVLANAGFTTVLDLRTQAEGTVAEKDSVESAGLTYYNLPLGSALPTAGELTTFRKILENLDQQPILVHCASGNRVGTAWAMYRIEGGTDPELAIDEGRAMGMRAERENAVRNHYKLESKSSINTSNSNTGNQ